MGLRLSVIEFLLVCVCDMERNGLIRGGYFTERKAELLPLIKFMPKK